MSKRSRDGLIICIVIVALVSVAVLCLFPWARQFSHTLTATKLDSNGKQVGTATISLDGIMAQSLFKKGIYNVTVRDIDGQHSATVNQHDFLTVSSSGGKYYEASFYHVYIPYPGTDSGGGSLSGIIRVCEDFDRWYIRLSPGDKEDVIYAVSVSGMYTAEEIMAYFRNASSNYRF